MAAGRAGRGEAPGEVVIQTYQPDHYAIQAAKEQDYEGFYEQELAYRRLMCYPPVWNLLLIAVSSPQEAQADACSEALGTRLKERHPGLSVIGPAEAAIARVNDIYRRALYVKCPDYGPLVRAREDLECLLKEQAWQRINVQFDFNPMNGF